MNYPKGKPALITTDGVTFRITGISGAMTLPKTTKVEVVTPIPNPIPNPIPIPNPRNPPLIPPGGMFKNRKECVKSENLTSYHSMTPLVFYDFVRFIPEMLIGQMPRKHGTKCSRRRRTRRI